MDLKVHSIDDIGSIRVLRLISPTTLPLHKAGEYAVLQFGHHPPRPYSIANAPNGYFLEFHIQTGHHTGNGVHAAKTLTTGGTVICHNIKGNYHFQTGCHHPLLLIAGGTGLAPMLAIAEACWVAEPTHPITLYYGGRHVPDLYMNDALNNKMRKTPHFRYIPVLSEERVEGVAHGLVGDVALHDKYLLKSRLYMAGPVDMLRNIYDCALAKGVSPDVIHSDLAEMTQKP